MITPCPRPPSQNWEFEYYINNRSNSYVRDSVLYLKPTLTADTIGLPNLMSGFDMNLWVRSYWLTLTCLGITGCAPACQLRCCVPCQAVLAG